MCECSSFQLEDAEAFAPECAVLLNVTPDHLDRHHDFEDYLRGEAADLRQPGQRRRRRLQRGRAGARRRRPGRLRPAGRLLPRSRPRLRRLPQRGDDLRGLRAADGGRRAVAARPAQRRQRDGGRAPRRRDGHRPRAPSARACGPSPASRTAWSGWRSSTGSSTSTTPRRPTWPRRSPRCARSTAACGRSSAAREGRRLRGPGRTGRRALRRLLPDRRGGRGAGERPGPVRRRAWSCAERRPRGGGPRGRRRDAIRARSSCSPRRARASTPIRDYEERGEHFRALGRGARAMSAFSPRAGSGADGRLGKPDARRPADRVQPPAHRDPVPARVRCRDGVQRELHDPLFGESGDSAYYLKRTLAVGAIGLVLMRLIVGARRSR